MMVMEESQELFVSMYWHEWKNHIIQRFTLYQKPYMRIKKVIMKFLSKQLDLE